MASSIDIYKHPSDVMLAAGFRYTNRGNTTRCAICDLKVSDWTCDMDPFTIHSERSPQCAFVRSQQSINNFQIEYNSKSSIMAERISERASNEEQRSAKRQKINISPLEVNEIKQIRNRSFSSWPQPLTFRSRMIEAGFFSCNINDRVLCLYCDLICHQWNIRTDDPCEVHKILSPTCLFVKKNLLTTVLQPNHTDYIDAKKRQITFPVTSDNKFSSVKELVDAGFYYKNGQLICFYCDGSINQCELKNHPIIEHVRMFPECNYAKELCGEELYFKIQQSMTTLSRNSDTPKSTIHHRRLATEDEQTLNRCVAARLDLPISRNLLQNANFSIATIEQCWKNQLQLKFDDFHSVGDLYFACKIHDRQIELLDVKKKEIIVPSVKLQMNGKQSAWSRSLSQLNASSVDLLSTFQNDLQKYQDARKMLGNVFKEDRQITDERKRSFIKWSSNKPTQREIIKGGWIIYDNYTKCPHCHMTYHHWKSGDDPFLIHQQLSPLCLFVLSSNPFHPNDIPIKETQSHFTDEVIDSVESRPYNGLAPSKCSRLSSITNRLATFNRYPNGCPANADELAKAGFHYINYSNCMGCFYCKRIISMTHFNSQPDKYLNDHLHFGRCNYTQQLNDCDTVPSTDEISNKCMQCKENEKQLLILSCRHCCLCKECGKINDTCPKCGGLVDAYVVVYLP